MGGSFKKIGMADGFRFVPKPIKAYLRGSTVEPQLFCDDAEVPTESTDFTERFTPNYFKKIDMRIQMNQISDKTPISGTRWSILKKDAIEPNYKQKSWYEALKPLERHLLEALRSAQLEQGDMDELRE